MNNKNKETAIETWLIIQRYILLPIGVIGVFILFFLTPNVSQLSLVTYWVLALIFTLLGLGGVLTAHEDDIRKRFLVTFEFIRQTMLVLIIVSLVLIVLAFAFSENNFSDLFLIDSQPDTSASIFSSLKDSSEIVAATIGAAVAFGGALVAINLATQGLLASKEQQNSRLQTFFDKLVEQSTSNIKDLEQTLMDFNASSQSFWDEFQKTRDEANKGFSFSSYDEFHKELESRKNRVRFQMNYFNKNLIECVSQLSSSLHNVSNDPVLSSAWSQSFSASFGDKKAPLSKNDSVFILSLLDTLTRSVSVATDADISEKLATAHGKLSRPEYFNELLVRVIASLDARANRFKAVTELANQPTFNKDSFLSIEDDTRSIKDYLKEFERYYSLVATGKHYKNNLELNAGVQINNTLSSQPAQIQNKLNSYLFPILIMGYYTSLTSDSKSAIKNLDIENDLNIASLSVKSKSDESLNIGVFMLAKFLCSFPEEKEFEQALESEFSKIAGLSHTRIRELVKLNAQRLSSIGQAIRDINKQFESVNNQLLDLFEENLAGKFRFSLRKEPLTALLDFNDSRYSTFSGGSDEARQEKTTQEKDFESPGKDNRGNEFKYNQLHQ